MVHMFPCLRIETPPPSIVQDKCTSVLAAHASSSGFDSPIAKHVQRLISRAFTYGAVGSLVLSWSWTRQPGYHLDTLNEQHLKIHFRYLYHIQTAVTEDVAKMIAYSLVGYHLDYTNFFSSSQQIVKNTKRFE